jgi:DNA polymerase III subunit epsilon
MESESLIASLGARLTPAESSLTDAAIQLVNAGPISSPELVAQVCQAIGVRRALAESLARAILGNRPDVHQGPDGRWRMSAVVSSASGTPPLSAASASDSSRAAPLTVGALRSGVAELPVSAMRWAVVDVETTGGRPTHGDRITEIAIVRVQGGEIIDVFETLVNPQVPIPPMISRLTRITSDMVRTKPVFSEIAHDVASRLEGHVFVAHNAAFDWRFVSHEVFRSIGQSLTGETLCTVRLARKLLPQLPRKNLDAVANHYSVTIPPEARHRAAGDAIATAKVLLSLLKEAEERSVTTWGALSALQRSGVPSAKRKQRLSMPGPVKNAGDGA